VIIASDASESNLVRSTRAHRKEEREYLFQAAATSTQSWGLGYDMPGLGYMTVQSWQKRNWKWLRQEWC
jgi:hypothetical protein